MYKDYVHYILSRPPRAAIAGIVLAFLFLVVIVMAVVFIIGFIRRRFYTGSKITDLVKIITLKEGTFNLLKVSELRLARYLPTL